MALKMCEPWQDLRVPEVRRESWVQSVLKDPKAKPVYGESEEKG